MSFEGYYQMLCPQGHHEVQDVHEYEMGYCSECREAYVLFHVVDDTNCDGVEEELTVTGEAWVERTSALGTKYKIPVYTYTPVNPERWKPVQPKSKES